MTLTPAASIVMATYNRKDELRQTIEAALNQTVPVEVIVMDDGSTDGTEQMMRETFPTVQYHRLRTNAGPNYQRTEAVRRASADIVFPIDDDSVLQSPDIVETTLGEFDHPRIGGVAIPFIDVRLNRAVKHKAPDRDHIYVTAAVWGCAWALRRELFLRVGGYNAADFMGNEESDLAIRMLNAGYVIRLGSSEPIHHLKSPVRDSQAIMRHHARNNVSFAWRNVPMPNLPVHVLATTWNLLLSGLKKRNPGPALRGLLNGYCRIWTERSRRQPVRQSTYRLFRRIRKAHPPGGGQCWRLNDIESALPPLNRSNCQVNSVTV